MLKIIKIAEIPVLTSLKNEHSASQAVLCLTIRQIN